MLNAHRIVMVAKYKPGERRVNKNVRGDVLVIGFTDDLWATPRQIDAISDHLMNAHVERRSIDPHTVGVTAIGRWKAAGSSLESPTKRTSASRD